MVGSGLGSLIQSIVLVVDVGRLRLGMLLLLILRKFLLEPLMLIDVWAWGPWTRDGGIPQGCPLSMMFIVALHLPWCRYLAAHEGIELHLYADNLECVSREPHLLLRAARFTTGCVRLVGQEPAPSKRVLSSTSRAVHKDMKDWVLSREGDRWSVKFDVRDLGGHLDTTFRAWSSTVAARVRLVIARLVLIFVLPLDLLGRVRIVRSMYLPAALHGIEASLLASDSLRKLRSSNHRVVWCRRQPLACVGAVLGFLCCMVSVPFAS